MDDDRVCGDQNRIAYYAGIFDGEGTIIISEVRLTSRGHRPSFVLSVSIEMAAAELLHELQVAFGGSIYQRKNRPEHYKPLTVWHLSSALAVRFLSTLLPFLRLKRSQAELALAFQGIKDNRHTTLRRKTLSNEELEERRSYKDAMQRLNRAT